LTKTEPPHVILSLKQLTQRTEKEYQRLQEKKQITYKGKAIKKPADFSIETLKARRAWSEVFLALKENNVSSRILFPEKLSLKTDGGIKVFHNK
jgi:hypothetical protein